MMHNALHTENTAKKKYMHWPKRVLHSG